MNSSGRSSKTKASRGFGVHGGSLIDIDRVRATQAGDTAGGRGADQFGELFPIAFLQALVPDSVEVLNDGHDGSEAQVRVSGTGGDFHAHKGIKPSDLEFHELPDDINQALNVDGLDGEPTIRYDVTYGLAPGDRHLRITVRMTNISEQALKIPSSTG